MTAPERERQEAHVKALRESRRPAKERALEPDLARLLEDAQLQQIPRLLPAKGSA